MRIATIVFALLSLSYPALPAPPRPTIAPFFNRIDDGPAFFVECINATSENVSSGSPSWPSADRNIRVDGRILAPSGGLGPGLTTQIGPGQQWRGIVVLRQSEQSYYPAPKLGALTRSASVKHLVEGRHTVAVSCGGIWSEDLVFYWDGERHGSAD
jgi:hypothetical protein